MQTKSINKQGKQQIVWKNLTTQLQEKQGLLMKLSNLHSTKLYFYDFLKSRIKILDFETRKFEFPKFSLKKTLCLWIAITFPIRTRQQLDLNFLFINLHPFVLIP